MTSTIWTLAQAARHGMLIRIECKGCGRLAQFLASEVAQFQPRARLVDDLRFHCKECDGRVFHIRPVHWDRERKRHEVVWQPTKLKG